MIKEDKVHLPFRYGLPRFSSPRLPGSRQ